VPAGGTFSTVQGPTQWTVTFVAEHDTLTLFATRYAGVREYAHRSPATQYTSYFVRGLGLVATRFAGSPQHARLVRAHVAGRAFEPVVVEPRSGVDPRPLSDQDVRNLALLGRVWGFAKYHHQAVTAGSIDWDAELFQVLPRVLDSGDGDAAASTIDAWLAGLGEPACEPCAAAPGDVHPGPDHDWIHDVASLGTALSGRLARIHRNRAALTAQRYVSHAPGVGNPIFHDEPYVELRDPDAGFRMLALFRYWNIIQYWFPYRDLLDDDWFDVLHEFVPVLWHADGQDAYLLAMLRLIGRVHDTHATLNRARPLRPPTGAAQLPVVIRFVEGRAVVTGYSNDELGPATGLRRGDAILRIDGAAVDSLVEAWRPYYPASNEPARLHDMARTLTRGAPGPVRLDVLRDGSTLELTAERAPIGRLDLSRGRTHDLPGETFRMLSDDVAYLKLSTVLFADVPEYFRRAADAAVFVIDIRNYPNQFVVFPLAGRLVDEQMPFALFTTGDASNPGAFRWAGPAALQPIRPRHDGAVVVLVDESSLSQAEYTAMALRAGRNTIVVGSTTAAADGNVSSVVLPGGYDTWITGIGVFYPDRTPTQRIGIVPDVEVRPTIAGIRDGRDEVLEAGISHALGREFRLPPR
jgi:hypothetical protein